MFSLVKPYGSVDVSVPIMVIDSTDGTPETGYDHATAGIDLWYRREGGARVAITEAALAGWDAAHTDGGVEHGSDGRGRLDLPDAACAWGTDGASYVEWGGTMTDMIVIGGVVELQVPDRVSGFLSGTHSTSTAQLGSNAPSSDQEGALLAFPTHGIARFITSYDTGTGVATFDAVSGLSLLDDDPWYIVWIGPMDSANLALIKAEVDTSVAGIQSTVGAINTKTSDLTFTKANELDVNIKSINEVEIVGDGDATPFDVP